MPPVSRPDDEMHNRFKLSMFSDRGMVQRAGLLMGRLDRLSSALAAVDDDLDSYDVVGESRDSVWNTSLRDSSSMSNQPLGETLPDSGETVSRESLYRQGGMMAREDRSVRLPQHAQSEASQPPPLQSTAQRGLPPAPSWKALVQMRKACERLQQLHPQPSPYDDAGQDDDMPPPTRLTSNVQAISSSESVSNQTLFSDIPASSSMSYVEAREVGFPSTSTHSHVQFGGSQGDQNPPSVERSMESSELLRAFRSCLQLPANSATEVSAPRQTLEDMLRRSGPVIRRADPARGHMPESNPSVQEDLTANSQHVRQSRALPSAGSVGHSVGSCKPCLFWYHQMCLKGERCDYCHIPHNMEEVKKVRPSKATRTLLRERQTRYEHHSL